MSTIMQEGTDRMVRLTAVLDQMPGKSGWLLALRREAAEAFAAQGVPTRRREEWKYTDLSRQLPQVEGHLFDVNSPRPLASDAVDAYAIAGLDALRMVFVDGCYVASLSNVEAFTGAGVRLASLAQLLEEDEALLQSLLRAPGGALENGLNHLNTAMMQDGAVLLLDKGVVLEKPLHLIMVGDQATAHLRHVIALGEQAEASVIEHYVGAADASGISNVVSDIHLQAGTRLKHYKLQQESEKRLHVGRIHAEVARDAVLASHSVALGAAMSRTDIVAGLDGEGAECTLNGLYLLGGRQHADHHTVIEHRVPNGRSRELYKGVLDGRAHAVFNGKVVVHPDAQKTDSKQSNGNLLLSKTAEVDTKPELEIYAGDVKCAHGATIGQLDANQQFYLRSRGLSEEEAEQVLTFAFADEVLASIALAPLRRHIERAAFAKLPYGNDLQGMLHDV